MFSIQHDLSCRFHPRLRRLEDQFRELLLRPFDAGSLIRLMRMEVECSFPGLGERDQDRIVDVVLEHMQVDDLRKDPEPAACRVDNIVPFPTGGRTAGERTS
jgi:hypothetical protein